MHINDFIEKYGDFDYFQKALCEIDILIYSQLSYISFDNVSFKYNEAYTLDEVSKMISIDTRKKHISVQRKAFYLLQKIAGTKRYRNVLISNYKHVNGDDVQFGAATFILPNKDIVVSFEGTDNSIVGWKEDAYFSFQYPTPSQKEACKYLNGILKKISSPVVVCGHSKGGNLALTASLGTGLLKRHKIKAIYSFDGPGLRKEEFSSFNYKNISKKLINIVPSQSMIGVLLYQENIDVIASSASGIYQHAVDSWIVDDDKLLRTERSKISIQFDSVVNAWIEKYDYDHRKQLIDSTFELFEKSQIKMLSDITENKLKSLCVMIKTSNFIDMETKLFVFQCLKTLVGNFGNSIINDEIEEFKKKLELFNK